MCAGGWLSTLVDVLRVQSLALAEAQYLAMCCLWQVLASNPRKALRPLLGDEVCACARV